MCSGPRPPRSRRSCWCPAQARARRPVGLIAAVPFLRGADFHGLAEARQSGDVEAAIRASIASHYEAVLGAARAHPAAAGGQGGAPLPVVATGHLYADGSLTVDESVRDIQVGRQAAVPLEVFGEGFDYVALGHLHREGRVFGRASVRYCGAPLPMSFAEADGAKYVLRVEVDAGAPVAVERVEIPSLPAVAAAVRSRSTPCARRSRPRARPPRRRP